MRNLFLMALPAVAGLYSQPAFVPPDFAAPLAFKAATYQLKPLGPELAKQDYDAYMSSIEHLQKTFSNGRWPNATVTMEDAVKDVENEWARFQARKSFTYAVLTADGTRELGCVYVAQSPKQGYDAVLRLWVTKAEFDKGFEAVLLQDVKQWLAKEWPFRKVAWPRREIPQEVWNALPDRRKQ